MINILLNWLIVTLAILVASRIVPGIRVDGWRPALLAALVLGFLNVLVKPLIILLTLPLTILTFGLFLLVVNAIIISLVGFLVRGFHVRGFWSAMFAAIVISLFSALATAVVDRLMPSSDPQQTITI